VDARTEEDKESKKEQEPFNIDFESSDFYVFRKEPYLNIGKLTAKFKHVKRNKVSDKLRRRDVQYYDLYALRFPKEEYNTIKGDQGYPCSKEDAQIK